MAYIVDGNNVMGQTPGWHRDKNKARRLLLEQVASFARIKKARVTVVFDGAPDREVPEASSFKGVKVAYAERGSDADTRIGRLVEASKDPRGLTVVTSDRRLAFSVHARGATVIRSGEFRRMLEKARAAQPDVEEGGRMELGDVDEWFRYFGASPDDEGEQ